MADQTITPLRKDDPRVIGPYRLVHRTVPARDRPTRARARRVVARCWTPTRMPPSRGWPPSTCPGRRCPAHRGDGPLGEQEVIGFAAALAEAVRSLHEVDVVHRDLKPSNLILLPAGPRLIDMGIARALDETSLTRTGMVVGSPGWISPEEYRGDGAGPAADVYGWALLVLYAATGRPPFGTGRPEVLAARVLASRIRPRSPGFPPRPAGRTRPPRACQGTGPPLGLTEIQDGCRRAWRDLGGGGRRRHPVPGTHVGHAGDG